MLTSLCVTLNVIVLLLIIVALTMSIVSSLYSLRIDRRKNKEIEHLRDLNTIYKAAIEHQKGE